MKVLLLLVLGSIILIAGCVQEPPREAQFKNDVITIDNYFVSNLAPYEKSQTSIQFEIHNNGDQQIPYLEVDFFDTPGFLAHDTDKVYPAKVEEHINRLTCDRPPLGEERISKCIFRNLEPLDARSVSLLLDSTEDVSSPTPHTISFAVRYIYSGSRDVSIPVIDGVTKKQPLTKFRQNDPSVGPIAIDVDPSIEREVTVSGKTIKENWAVGGDNPLPFLTKFKFRQTVNKEKVKDVSVTATNLRLKLNGLSISGTCNFCDINDVKDLKCDGTKIDLPERQALSSTESTQYFWVNLPSRDVSGTDSQYTKLFLSRTVQDGKMTHNIFSTKPAAVPFDTLVCVFKPTLNQPEYSASISAYFAYKYEFIKTQDFVVQPLPQ